MQNTSLLMTSRLISDRENRKEKVKENMIFSHIRMPHVYTREKLPILEQKS